MFRLKLTIAFAILLGLLLLQGGMEYWSSTVSELHSERRRVSNELLSGFIEVSAGKQRLKVWFAQRLLSDRYDIAPRDALIESMKGTLARLRDLAIEERGFFPQSNQLSTLDDIDLLRSHIDFLQEQMSKTEDLPSGASRSEAWNRLTSVFDMSRGRDLRQLLDDNILAKRKQAVAAREAANAILQTAKWVTLGVVFGSMLCSVVLVIYLNSLLRKPLDKLMAGTKALAKGDLSYRLNTGKAEAFDEFDAVSRSFNSMATELQQHRANAERDVARLENAVADRTRELSDANEALRNVDVQRMHFFAEVSHELRTPLTVIRGEAEITLRGRQKPVDEYEVALRRIVDASSQVTRLIDELLIVAKGHSSAIQIERERVDLGRLLASCSALFLSAAVARDVVIECVHAEPDISTDIFIEGDAGRLQQLFQIMLDNAVRYSLPGGRVWVQAVREADTVTASVRDEGIGIAADDVAHVFERNFRGSSARKHATDGLGLGMHIAKMIVDAHDADIDVVSAPGLGTTVTVSFVASPKGATQHDKDADTGY